MEFKDYVLLASVLLNLIGLLFVLKKESRLELNKKFDALSAEVDELKNDFTSDSKSFALLESRTNEHITLTRERFNKIDETYRYTFTAIENNLEKVSNNQTWISDGMIKIASKLNVDLEKRPL